MKINGLKTNSRSMKMRPVTFDIKLKDSDLCICYENTGDTYEIPIEQVKKLLKGEDDERKN